MNKVMIISANKAFFFLFVGRVFFSVLVPSNLYYVRPFYHVAFSNYILKKQRGGKKRGFSLFTSYCDPLVSVLKYLCDLRLRIIYRLFLVRISVYLKILTVSLMVERYILGFGSSFPLKRPYKKHYLIDTKLLFLITTPLFH